MDADAKSSLLKTVPYGLYAACTRTNDGEHHAFLLSWMTQASFDPPLVACCVHRDSSAYKHLSQDEAPIAINLLSNAQQPLAQAILQGAAFEDGEMNGEPYKTGANGCALLPSTLGALEADVVDEAGSGDHAVLVCEITDAHRFNDGDPLTHEGTGWSYAG